MTDNDFDDDFSLRPSKTQRKQAMQASQDLGEKLLTLTARQRQRLPLSETLSKAIDDCLKTTAREALRRQKQYIGKLMRHEDIDAIEQILNDNSPEQIIRAQDRWQARLTTSREPEAFDTFLEQYPHADRQRLGQLIRAIAQAGIDDVKRSHALAQFRQYLHEVLAR